ncbi:MAG: flippase-like domain-containing protein [Planctomycetes bacterium]|nr:flippase-like domain-containing protein [Planctomycetota bacterium]
MRKVDEAVFVYRYRLGTVGLSLLLSFANHLVTIAGVSLIGVALADELQRASFFDLLVIYPVVGVVSALPLAPAGLGIGETLFGSFYAMFGRSYDIGVLTSVIYRLTFIAWSLLGGVFLLTGRERVPSDPLEGEAFGSPPLSASAAEAR